MKRNFAYTAVSVGSRMLVGVVLFLLLARLWGPETFGLYSYAFSMAALLILVVDFGFVVYLMREVAAQPSQAEFIVMEALRAKLMLLLLALLVLWPVVFVSMQVSTPWSLVVPLLLAAALMSFGDFCVAPLRALGRFDLEAFNVTLGNAAQFVLAGAVAWMGASPESVAWATVLARLVFLLLAWRALQRVVPAFHWRLKPQRSIKAAMRGVLPYGADGMLVTVWNQLDVIVVRWLFGLQGVGLYSAGQKIVLGVGALATVVGSVMVPRLASQATRRDATFWRTATLTCALMSGIGLCFALPLWVAPASITNALFGPSYSNLATLLPWFGAAVLVRFVGASAGAVITGAGRQASRAMAQFVGLSFAALAVAMVAWLHAPLAAIIGAMVLGLFVTMLYTVWHIEQFRRTALNTARKA